MRLLDLYCGAGIAAIGYAQAGFECTGVDIDRKSQYTGGDFICADALDVLADVAWCRQFDAIHASPPCQLYSPSTGQFRASGKVYGDLIGSTRTALDRVGRPYVIENVPQAPIRPDVVLYGTMFGLGVIRRRHFELGGWWMLCPYKPTQVGSVASGDFVSVFGKAGYRKYTALPVGWRPKFDQGSIRRTWQYAMGIPEGYEFRDVEIAEAIPPAYSRYIGERLAEHIGRENKNCISAGNKK
jgi:hypothetical protein